MLQRRTRALLGFFLLATGSSCAEIPQDDDAAVMEKLSELGLAERELEFDGNIIRVDRDLIVYRDKLLNDEYVAEDGPSDQQKGYKYFTVGSSYRGNIKLQWAASPQTPDQRIKDAFVQAAQDWNFVPSSAIDISVTNSGEPITVHQINGGDWPGASPCDSTSYACTELPVGTKPSAHIWIRSILNWNPVAHPCDWTTAALNHTARHELGHAIGFDHPKEPGSAHITGSEPCTTSPSTDCPFSPNYSTVMIAGFSMGSYPSCSISVPVILTEDDVDSCSLLY